jgi:GNAT superfamily N-acetyltransferase
MPGAVIEEGYAAGCIGRIAQLHAAYYAASNGFGVTFEARVARELADFCLRYQRGRDGLWLVRDGDRIEGSIAIDGEKAARATETGGAAHLRWFITSAAVQGQGLGKRLLDLAMDFVDGCGYGSTTLWTVAGLDAARHLYASRGFHLVHESPGDQWGTVVTEQRFERAHPARP